MPKTRGSIQRQRAQKETAKQRKGLKEDEYEIEFIIKHEWYSLPNGGTEVRYRVHWKGYSSKEKSWITAEDINAPLLTKLYWEKRRDLLHI